MPIFSTNTASINLLQITGSSTFSGSSNVLTVLGSGSTIFTISGSNGAIFSINDNSASSTLFNVSSASVSILNVDTSKNVSISGSLIVTSSLIVNPAAPGFSGPGALIGDITIGQTGVGNIETFSGGLVSIGSNGVLLGPNNQTRIGFNDFDGTDSAVCTIYSLDKGLLIPRNSSAGKLAISAPARGLMIYETSSITEGIWYYNSGSNYQGWTRVLNNSGSQSITGSMIATSFTGPNNPPQFSPEFGNVPAEIVTELAAAPANVKVLV